MSKPSQRKGFFEMPSSVIAGAFLVIFLTIWAAAEIASVIVSFVHQIHIWPVR